ncbi:hypothetical protein JF550_01710 [Microbacterium esteraromaticum]|uniref:Uncharacterized protein n=1 Tax=Microbacterium esteraromaticum TaxID=57043 RepID=A0A939IU52_9MICO|nr:hypothetical protein [Microbacterium esteraromaticum]MBN8204669.1 hypothetical protein [Microbacterium esteraromaticum]MBN8414823.1 hypothetical protein [Microbacterium esteraromaticum]
MDWIADVSQGDWLRPLLDEGYGTMHGVVPRGYAAYARVFHPAVVRTLPGRAVPTQAEYKRMPDAEAQGLIDQYVDRPATWADAADAFGTVMHPLAQWGSVVRTPPEGDWSTRVAPDGREFSAPYEGEMEPAQLARIAAHLATHTETPDAGVAAVWAGYGGLLGFYGESPSRTFLSFSSDDDTSDTPDAQALAHQEMLARSIHDPFNNVFRKPTWQPGILSDEISKGPQLELPDREYVLFSAPPAAFVDPAWILDATWRDLPGEEHGFAPSAQHPNILWPTDRAWVMVSEIDFDSTIVAGSAELIAALCADPLLEAAPIPVNADLSWQADLINR